MANKFTVGMRNLVEVLNQMWDAFAAGPYNAVPLTGGTMTGALVNTVRLSAPQIIAGAPGALAISSLSGPRTGTASNTPYEAARFSVSQTPGGWDGAFVWSTLNGRQPAGPTYPDPTLKEGYMLRLAAIDSRYSTLSGTLFSVTGAGDISAAGDIAHISDNTKSFGLPAFRASTVYAATGAINTSDARLKTELRPLSEHEMAAAIELAGAIGVYRWIEAVAQKSGDAREHIGSTVQVSIEIMESHGLDPFNYGFICHDEWGREVIEHPATPEIPAIPSTGAVAEIRDEQGNVTQAAAPASPGRAAIEARDAYTEVLLEAGDRYGFRYDELLLFIVRGQAARQDALEQRIAALEVMP